MKIIKKNWYRVIALVHFGTSFYTDRLIFNPVSSDNICFLAFSKIIYFIILQMIWLFIAKTLSNSTYRKIVWNALPIGIVLAIGIICIYPSLQYNGDMPYFFYRTINYDYTGSLHWLSSMFYIIAMMLIPSYAGPTILMGICSALLVGYVITLFENKVKKKCVPKMIFFTPPFIFYSLFPNRLPMVTLGLLLFFSILFSDYMSNEKPTRKKIVLLSFLAGMLSVWRIECLTFLIMAPIVMILAEKERITIKKFTIYFSLVFLMHLAFTLPEKVTGTTSSIEGKLYPFANYTFPTMEIMGIDTEKYAQEYQIINGYWNVDIVHENMERDGELYWKSERLGYDALQNPMTASMGEYEKAVFQLIEKEPLIFIKSRIKAFGYSTNNYFGFSGNYELENGRSSLQRRIWLDVFGGLPIEVDAICPYMRICGAIWNIVKRVLYTYYWIWGALCIGSIIAVRRRNWILFVCILEMFAYIGIVFLMAPATVFKYYWPVYAFVLLMISSGIVREGKVRNRV